VTDAECVALLQWAAPRLGLRWAGLRRVRRQVCRRVARRISELGLASAGDYRALVERDPAERRELDARCRISISRFFRDRAVYETLSGQVLPALVRGARAQGRHELHAWSAGCASGEEPYSLALVWTFELAPRNLDLSLRIVATDSDPHLIERARRACYPASSLRELPADWRERAFEPRGRLCCLRPELRAAVVLRCEDLRERQPQGPFDLVLCRNVAFTYFADEAQRRALERIVERLCPGGALVIGRHESLPGPHGPLVPWPGERCVWARAA
jgi:chemotaxis protein methyltransferase CheR